MTEEERKELQEEYSKKTGGQLIAELARLVLLLIWKIIKKGIRVLAKFLLFIIESIQEGCEKLAEWWNAKDTQEKVAEIKATLKKWCIQFGKWCVIAAKATGKGIKIGAIATWHGIVKGTKATILGIIHLKPTIIKIGQAIAKGSKAFAAWTKRCGRGMKLSHIRRKRAYQRFRRNKGFKGLIIDSSNAVRNGITMFMEEDQEEAAPDAVTEDDLLKEEIEERVDEDNKAHKIGKKIFYSAKNIVDID